MVTSRDVLTSDEITGGKIGLIILTIIFLAIGVGILYWGSLYPHSDFNELCGALGFGLIILTLIISIIGYRSFDEDYLLNGIKGEAEILDTEDIFNEYGVTIKFQLKITLPDRPPYQIEQEESVRHNCLDSVRIGTKIPVYVDPKDSKFILLDFPKNKVQN